jgi:sterol desaturase/sphingolipid hydroxylase (fatty acid hydroxylase superfamily)
VYAIGPSVLAVLVFEIMLNGTALFNHANIRLPAMADRALRMFLVTPDMHRVHHSTLKSEHNSNYGFALSIWDRIFGTYTAQARAGQTVGLKQWQDDTPTKLLPSLLMPWRK